MPIEKLCRDHQKASQGNCAACRRDLCDACALHLSQGRTLCAACFQSQKSVSGGKELASFRKTWTQFKWFQILAIPAFIAFIYFINKANIPGCAVRIYAYLYFALPVFLVVYCYFFLKLRCPSCRSYALFYLGDSILEFARSKFCPRCGQQLKA